MGFVRQWLMPLLLHLRFIKFIKLVVLTLLRYCNNTPTAWLTGKRYFIDVQNDERVSFVIAPIKF